MPNGFPAFRPSRKSPPHFPNDQPPTLFHPASPKLKPTKPTKDIDTASMASTSTFASTISLLKENVKAKLPHRKGTNKALNEKASSSTRPKKDYSARARTAEAYMIMAITK